MKSEITTRRSEGIHEEHNDLRGLSGETKEMTTISQPAALRRFHQGLFHLLGTTDQGRKKPDPESLLAVTTVMAYLAAYAFPNSNLYDLKQRMSLAFEPLKNVVEIDSLLERAINLAEVFRRPWTEAGNPEGHTI